MQYDIIALQQEGHNVALGCTPAGHAWLAENFNTEGYDFLEFLQVIPRDLRIGVLDPTGKLLNFCSGVLH